ncbi:MAG TPA: 4-hydroxy-tetrahydrodipicolinate reductase [Fibrobacteria bacterium]|nr:4-hydroxy-tetrahydrodipicolinate reductase [Fibrobacteria bacterium]
MEPGLVIVGALGRMGRALQEAALVAGIPVEGLVDRPETTGTPSPVEGVTVAVSGSLQQVAAGHRVAILFSSPENTIEVLRTASVHGMGLVVGTTGMGEAGETALREAACHVPVVAAANYSVGVNLMLELVETASRVLGDRGYDAEIVEAHHKHKKDAPSGTALMLAKAVAKGRGVELADVAVYGREGLPGERPNGEIGIHAVRGGSVVGDHWVTFFGEGERIEIHHHAESRRTFAEGAVRAAKWVAGRKPGLYTMRHVLGFD